MDRLVVLVLKMLAKSEFQLENIRQLLGEEVQFTVMAAYRQIVSSAFSEQIDLYSLLNYLGGERNAVTLESVLKFYSSNELRLNPNDFSKIILTREDKLIKMLTKERQSKQQIQLPQYLTSYCKKIWYIEEELHEQLNKLKVNVKSSMTEGLKRFKKDDYLDEQALREAFMAAHTHSCEECPEINFQIGLRYLKKGENTQNIQFSTFLSLLIPQNCNTITSYLKVQEQTYKRINSKPKHLKDPFLHRQFQKMSIKNDTHFCFREIKSVEDHIKRNKNMPNSHKIKRKIEKYSNEVASKLTIFFKKMRKIVKLTSQINENKKELINSCESNFQGLFREITNSIFLVPSELQHYLKTVGVHIKLSQLFVIFKKYGDSITGKITIVHFIRIFIPYGSEYSFSDQFEAPLNHDFRVAALTCLLKEIQNELKIESIKTQLASQVQLRELYDGLIPDEKGRISRTDIQVAIKRAADVKIGDNQLEIFWARMGKSKEEYINYDTFMYEMLPRTKKRPQTTKQSQSSFRI